MEDKMLEEERQGGGQEQENQEVVETVVRIENERSEEEGGRVSTGILNPDTISIRSHIIRHPLFF